MSVAALKRLGLAHDAPEAYERLIEPRFRADRGGSLGWLRREWGSGCSLFLDKPESGSAAQAPSGELVVRIAKGKAPITGAFVERGTGLEPANLSLGSPPRPAWIDGFRSTIGKRTRSRPLETA
jgi:hypothetical protein